MDLERVRGRPLRQASLAWFASLLLGLAVATVAVATGFAISVVLIALALTTTAIGTLVPMLGDSGDLSTPFGAHVLAIGAAMVLDKYNKPVDEVYASEPSVRI